MSSKDQRKAPILRFKGYTNDWEQRRLKDTAQFAKGVGYSKKDLEKSGTPIILYGRLYTKYETVIKNVDTFAQPKKDTIYSKGGEIIVPASGETAEDISIASVVEPQGIILGGDLNIIYPNICLNPNFLALAISYGKPHTEMRKRAQGKSIVHLHNSDLSNIKLKFPSNEEQNKISNVIEKLDFIITLQQRKIKLLSKIKKYLLQNIFIQESSIAPVLRFSSFKQKWNSTKIGKVMDVGSVKRIHQADWKENGIPFYRARDIITIRQNKKLPSPIYISKEKYEDYSKISGKVNINDLLVTGVGTIGVPMLVAKTPIYFKDGNIIWLKNSNKLNGKFLFYIFQSSKIQDYIHSTSGIGTVPTYTIDSAKKTPITFPEEKEQDNIAKLLDKINNMIYSNETKKRKLESLKNYLLQNMFI